MDEEKKKKKKRKKKKPFLNRATLLVFSEKLVSLEAIVKNYDNTN